MGKRTKILKGILFYLLLLGLSFLRALATYMFIIPNSFAPGGVSGIASIIYNAVLPTNPVLAETWLSPAFTLFIMNVPLIILSFVKIGKNYSINSTLVVLIYSLLMAMFSKYNFPQFIAKDLDSSVMILAALGGGIVSGFSLGLMLLNNMSAGGTDIIARAVYQNNSRINIQWLIFMLDSAVVVMSGVLGFLSAKPDDTSTEILVKVMTPIFYSFISLYACSKIADIFTTGLQSSVVFNIITEKSEEISQAILRKIKRGATIICGKGIYTLSERKIVVCVVRKKQSAYLKKAILEIDPSAFLYITDAREVNGKGFKSISG